MDTFLYLFKKLIMKKELITFIVINILVGLIFYLVFRKNKTEYITKIETVEKIVIKKNLIPVAVAYPEFIPIDKIINHYDTVKLSDTIYIIKDYAAERIYNDTIFDNDSIFLSILDTLQYNRIKNRQTEIKLFKTTKIKEYDFTLYGGLFHIQNQLFISTGIDGGIIKDNNIFEFGIGTNKTYLFSYDRVFYRK